MEYTTETLVTVNDQEIRAVLDLSHRLENDGYERGSQEFKDYNPLDVRVGAAVFDKRYGRTESPILTGTCLSAYEGLGFSWERVADLPESVIASIINIMSYGLDSADYVSYRALDAAHGEDSGKSVFDFIIALNPLLHQGFEHLLNKLNRLSSVDTSIREIHRDSMDASPIEEGLVIGHSLQSVENAYGEIDFRQKRDYLELVTRAVERAAVNLRWGEGQWEEEMKHLKTPF